jgi:glycosyltransferase involved in cell wall biosynthesis
MMPASAAELEGREDSYRPLAGKKVMWVVGYIPGKLGSFERFMEVVARGFAARGAELSFVFRGSPLPAFADALRQAGAKVHVIPMRSRLDWRFVRRLSRLVGEEDIDILHSNFDLANFATSLVAVSTGVPIYIWHQHNFMGQRFSLLRWVFLKFLNRVADRVLCVTDSMKGHLVGKGVATQRLTRVYIGPDLDLFSAAATQESISLRSEFGFPASSAVLICVGAALPEKGQLCLMEAFAQIVNQFPDARLLLVGALHGPCASLLQSAVMRLGLQAKAHLTEIRSDVPRLIRQADISVVPPTEEVSVLAIMESMAASKPVVASRVGGIPEVVSHGESGLLVPPADASALATALSDLLRNPWLRHKMGGAGRRIAEANFNASVAARQMVDVYENLISSRSNVS